MSVPAAAIGGLPAAGLPAVAQTRAPAYVRTGSTAVKQDYATAVGFEEMLLGQLSQSLVQSSGLNGEAAEEGEGEGGGGGGSQSGLAAGGGGGGMVSALLPQTLAEGLTRDGGVGLATQLMHALDPAAANAAPGASTGGTSQ